MRRRPPPGGVPVELDWFDADAWPGDDVLDRFETWREARRMHAESHEWPGGALAMLAREADVRALLTARRMLSWGRTRAEMERDADELERRYGRRPRIDLPPLVRDGR